MAQRTMFAYAIASSEFTPSLARGLKSTARAAPRSK